MTGVQRCAVLRAMSIFKTLSRRSENSPVVVAKEGGKVLVAVNADPGKRPRENWRAALRKLTNDGLDQLLVLHNLSQGVAQQFQLPDGRVSEPVVPTPEVQRAAAVDLLHMLHGKPVAQTEVVRAEQEAEDLSQYAAMSQDDLLRAALPLLKAEMKRKMLTGETSGQQPNQGQAGDGE